MPDVLPGLQIVDGFRLETTERLRGQDLMAESRIVFGEHHRNERRFSSRPPAMAGAGRIDQRRFEGTPQLGVRRDGLHDREQRIQPPETVRLGRNDPQQILDANRSRLESIADNSLKGHDATLTMRFGSDCSYAASNAASINRILACFDACASAAIASA